RLGMLADAWGATWTGAPWYAFNDLHAVMALAGAGRIDDGIRFLRERETHWGSGNLFTVHNWWHMALYQLEAGQTDEVLAIYDREIHNESSAPIALELLDASALLWRLHLDDVDCGDRLGMLADAWGATWTGAPWYAFNDLHAVMALAGAGRIDDAEVVIDRMDAWLAVGTGANVAMTARIGLPASRAVVAFAEDRYEEVLDALLPIRRQLHHFGGSHAQRDALQRTLLEAALRGGHPDLARALSSERLAVRDTSVYSWVQRARALTALGDAAGAAAAQRTAAIHQSRFAATAR
ncbi:MAG: tetratricopeptide repeat protein, partial [Ilumatobacteraceae bacterium]